MEYKKNSDGSDMLDENGNKIPVEITDEGSEADKKIAAAIAPLVEEIKGLRTSNGMLKDLLDKKEDPTPTPPAAATEEEKLAVAVKKVLDAQKSSDAQANKRIAFDKFIADNKEFHPDNDTLGLKQDALTKKFARFNTDGLQTVEDFYSVVGDAKNLLMGNDNQSDTYRDQRQNSIQQPPIPRNSIKPGIDNELSPKERRLMETTGRTKEQILKMKKNHPEMLEQILEFVRD